MRALWAVDLLSQLSDQDAQILRLGFASGAPYCAQKCLMSQNPSGVSGEEEEQIELLRGQMQLLPANRNGVGLGVDLEVAFSDLALRGLCTCGLPKMCAYAGE